MADPFWTLLAPIVAPAPLIHADQNGPRPPKPYATLDIVNAGAAAWLVEHEPGPAGLATFTEHRLVTVEVQFFGQGAQERASALGLRLRLPRHVDRAEALRIGIGVVGGATSLSALLDETQYEDRSVVEFTAHVAADVEDDVGLIEHADFEYPPDAPVRVDSARSDSAPAAAVFTRTASFDAPPPTTT
jgi:hypothetical protein